MSGGVDSAVAAALLKAQGLDVVGMSLKTWSNDQCHEVGARRCCSLSDIEDARACAHRLGIPYYVLDVHEAFQRDVIDYFLKEYEEGQTPNPCVHCNEKVKFGLLLEKAKGLGADAVATGHYARVAWDPGRGRHVLRESVDPSKDQTYVLFQLSQQALAQAVFPVGELKKEEVREVARGLGLAVADKPDSQGICFVAKNDRGAYLQKKIGDRMEAGEIVSSDGRVLGRHEGIPYFTVGQRRGLGVTNGEPLYVLRVEKETRRVVVGTRGELDQTFLSAGKLNWIASDGRHAEPIRAHVKIRYGHPKQPAWIDRVRSGRARVRFDEAQFAITPGQATVFYDGDVVLGGGWIERESADESQDPR